MRKLQTPRFLQMLLVALMLLCQRAIALDLNTTLAQMHHTAWTLKSGGPGEVTALAQTNDGSLWLGTPSGLYRFDGVKFWRFEPRGAAHLLSNYIFSLYAPLSGGLWVGYDSGGVSFIQADTAINYPPGPNSMPLGSVIGFAAEKSGRVWLMTTRGPAVFYGNRWVRLAENVGYPTGVRGYSIVIDAYDSLWMSTGSKGIYVRPHGQTGFQHIPIHDNNFASLSASPDGRVWAPDSKARLSPLQIPGIAPSWQDRIVMAAPDVNFTAWDRDGAMWIAATGSIQRVTFESNGEAADASRTPRTETYSTTDGLSGRVAYAFLEDREGSVWLGTNGGLDQFRPNRLRSVTATKDFHQIVMQPGPDGSLWISSWSQGLHKLSGSLERTPLSLTRILALYSGPDHSLLIATARDGVWTYDGKSAQQLPPYATDFAAGEQIDAMTVDKAGDIWIAVSRLGTKLFRFADGHWMPNGGVTGIPDVSIRAMIEDGNGGVVFGFNSNQVGHLENGVFRLYDANDGIMVGSVTALHLKHGRLWVGGEFGIQILADGHFKALRASTEDALEGISGIVETDAGDLWLNGNRGITRVTSAEVARGLSTSGYLINYEQFNQLDGLNSTAEQERPLATAIEGTDKRLWFALTSGLVTVDPTHIYRNTVVPPVVIRSIRANGLDYEPRGPMRLPIGARDIQIDYSANSLAVPERVRFKYRLDGFDKTWQDAGTRRQAFYTNLVPGDYVFHVIAANDGGEWNNEGARMAVRVPAAYYETKWFALLIALVSLALIWTMYQYRLRGIRTQMRERLEERLTERERIARELHDTLLQSMHGLIFRIQAMANRVLLPESERQMITREIDLADRVLAEGRDRVSGLRSAPLGAPDFAQVLISLGEDLAKDYPTAFVARVDGRLQPLHPVVREEVHQVGAEALTNAFRHSKATRIDLLVHFDVTELVVKVNDDGIGFDAKFLAGALAGHWGLIGMRERAVKIHAQLDITSRPGEGSRLVLRIPASIAYREWSKPWHLRSISRLLGFRKDSGTQ